MARRFAFSLDPVLRYRQMIEDEKCPAVVKIVECANFEKLEKWFSVAAADVHPLVKAQDGGTTLALENIEVWDEQEKKWQLMTGASILENPRQLKKRYIKHRDLDVKRAISLAARTASSR